MFNIKKVTGVLLLVPALLNAAYDIYAIVLKLPRTEAEKVNEELFQKYFNKSPLVVMPVPVKHSVGIVEVKFSIYDEGDVYVEYGKQTQWFSFPKVTSTRVSKFDLISGAYAEQVIINGIASEHTLSSNTKISSQTSSISGKEMLRSRVYENGIAEHARIDIRSGEIIDLFRDKVSVGDVARHKNSTRTIKINVIDLNLLRPGK